MDVKFYTQGCPKCKVLKAKLDEQNIQYELIDDFEVPELRKKGVASLPILEVDGVVYTFENAIKWLREK